MSDEYIVPEVGPVDPDAVPETYQQLAELIGSVLRIPFPSGYTQIVVSSTTPLAADQGKIWLKVNGGGVALGFFKYAAGDWLPIAPSNVYFAEDIGTANAMAITVANYPYASLQPGLFVVQANAANTGAATLTVNAFAAKPIKIRGADPYANAFLADGYYLLFYTGTVFEALNPKDEVITPIFSKESVHTGLTISNQTVTLGGGITGVPKLVEVRFVCATPEAGYSIGDSITHNEVDGLGAGGDHGIAYTVSVNAGSVSFVAATGWATREVAHKSTGAFTTFTPANWNMTVRAWA